MSDDSRPIGPDSPLCDTLTCLPEKFVVDFANGIDVVGDHLREQDRRTGFFSRLLDGFTGRSGDRQAQINAGLAHGVKGSLEQLNDLTESVVKSGLALDEVIRKIAVVKDQLAQVAQHSASVRQQVDMLSDRLDARLDALWDETNRISFIQKVQLNMDAAFYKWVSGRFNALAPAARCYAVLEELRWGALGEYCSSPHADPRQRREFLQMVVDRATHQLAVDAAISPESPAGTLEVWMAPQPGWAAPGEGDIKSAVAYLADGMTVEAAPFATSAALQSIPLPLTVPRVARPRRIATAMVEEVIYSELRHV